MKTTEKKYPIRYCKHNMKTCMPGVPAIPEPFRNLDMFERIRKKRNERDEQLKKLLDE